MDESTALALASEQIGRLTELAQNLGAELDRLTQTYADYRDIARASTIESVQTITRYRTALEQIANRDDNEMVAARTLHYDMRGWARAALETKE